MVSLGQLAAAVCMIILVATAGILLAPLLLVAAVMKRA